MNKEYGPWPFISGVAWVRILSLMFGMLLGLYVGSRGQAPREVYTAHEGSPCSAMDHFIYLDHTRPGPITISVPPCGEPIKFGTCGHEAILLVPGQTYYSDMGVDADYCIKRIPPVLSYMVWMSRGGTTEIRLPSCVNTMTDEHELSSIYCTKP